MPITKELKAWLVDNTGIEKDATDDECRKAVGEAIVNGNLTAEKLAELTADKDAEKAGDLANKLDAIANGLAKLTEIQTKAAEVKTSEPEKKEEKKTEPEKKVPELSEEFEKKVGEIGTEEKKESAPRVKNAAEMYDTTKTALLYPSHDKYGMKNAQAGRQINYYDGPLETSSERDKAVIGAFAQFLCSTARHGGLRSLGYASLPEHSKELLQFAMREYKWGGSTVGGDEGIEDIKRRRLTPREQKDLIDDAVSGGLEAVPIVFDDDLISAPLLQGELFPLVNVVPIARGRRIEGVASLNVTMTWGGIDATAIAIFNTAAYVTAFDTTIYRLDGAVRIGLDFLSDSPIDFAAHFSAQYGERLLQELDDVIATGNGTTQPLGIMATPAVTAVAFGGATNLGNYENLRFTVAKPEHSPAMQSSIVFCGTEQSYSRARAIPVGAADVRRVFGMDHDSYSLLNRPYKINESLNNTQIFYAVLKRYRMYRRRGLTLTSSTAGDTLTRRNELLIVATSRYGGQLERAATAALTTTAPA